MDALKEVLQTVGVWPWLCERLKGASEAEILGAVDGDFEGVVLNFQKRQAPETEAGPEGQ